MFSGSIKENVSFANPKATEDEINSALKKANAWDFVNDFPDKLNTEVGDREFSCQEVKNKELLPEQY